MKQHIANIALVVSDYDEAIRFYTEKLSLVAVAPNFGHPADFDIFTEAGSESFRPILIARYIR